MGKEKIALVYLYILPLSPTGNPMQSNSNRKPQNKRLSPQDSLPEPRMIDIDFPASQQLARALTGRTNVEGHTVDPPGTHIIDDGLSIKRKGKGWKISVSIVDLPALIPNGSRLEKMAAERLKESYFDRRPRRIWPTPFLDKYASMTADTKRPALTFKICLDENLEVTQFDIARTVFWNKGEHADGDFSNYEDFSEKRQQDWCELARGLYRKRCNDLAYSFDVALNKTATRQQGALTDPDGQMENGKLLIHEVMRLTSRVAAEYTQTHNLIVPFKSQKIHIETSLVTDDQGFDRSCNKICTDLARAQAVEGLPYVHVNSPMRRYHDYLALKVIGRHLSGLPENLDVRREISNLKGAFDRAAGGQAHLLSDNWSREWHSQLNAQRREGVHPFKEVHPNNTRLADVIELRTLCKDKKWSWPLIAERELRVQGTSLYFTAMALRRDRGRDFNGWAVAANRGVSLNLAAQRILASPLF